MSQLIAELRERRKVLLAEGKTISDTAVIANRGFTEAEQTRFHSITNNIDAIDERIGQLAGEQKRAEDVTAVMDGYRGHRPYVSDDKLAQFRSAVLERNPAPIDVRWDRPRSYYQPGVERRDLLTTSPANFSPVSFFGRLVEHMVETSAVLKAGATLITTDSGEPLRVPRTSALSSAGIVTEGAVIPESDPGLGVATLGAFKYAFRVEVSTEMTQDSGVDLPGYIAREAGIALGNALGNHLINGTGTGQPRGVYLDATLGVGPTGTATTLGSQGAVGQGSDILVNLVGSLAEPYTRQPATAWLMRTQALSAVRALKAPTTGELVGMLLVGEGPAGSQGSAVGAPIYVDPFLQAFGVLGNRPILYGDWSRYFVRMVNGIRFERSNDFAFDRDMVNFRAVVRADGALVDTTGAIKWFAHTT